MTTEDDEFNRIEREAAMRKEAVQETIRYRDAFPKDYALPKPWVGLTAMEIEAIGKPYEGKNRSMQAWGLFACAIEEALRKKNL